MNSNFDYNLKQNENDINSGGTIEIERGLSLFNNSNTIRTLPDRTTYVSGETYKPYLSVNNDIFTLDKSTANDDDWVMSSKNKRMFLNTSDGFNTTTISTEPTKTEITSKIIRINGDLYTYGVNNINFHNIENTNIEDNSLVINNYTNTNVDKIETSKALIFQNNLTSGSLVKVEPTVSTFNIVVQEVNDEISTIFASGINLVFSYPSKNYLGYIVGIFDGVSTKYFTIYSFVIIGNDISFKINTNFYTQGQTPIAEIFQNKANGLIYDGNRFNLLDLYTTDIHPTNFNIDISDVNDYSNLSVKNITANNLNINQLTANSIISNNDWFVENLQTITYNGSVYNEITVLNKDLTNLDITLYSYIEIYVYPTTSYMPVSIFKLTIREFAGTLDISYDVETKSGYLSDNSNVETLKLGYLDVKKSGVSDTLLIYFTQSSGISTTGDYVSFNYRVISREKNTNVEFSY